VTTKRNEGLAVHKVGVEAYAVVNNEPQIQELLALYAMISRMRVLVLPADCRVR
jgi:hypothetical protein